MTTSIILATPQFPEDFERVGYYDPNSPRFILEVEKPEEYRGLYAWAAPVGDVLIALRFGVAWRGALAGRIDEMHNPWLGGTFKPNDPSEQLKRWATIQCAPAGMILMGCRMPTEDSAYDAEGKLRNRHQATMTLDFMVQGNAVRRRRDELRQQWERTGIIPPLCA